jgi:hypothetical protein
LIVVAIEAVATQVQAQQERRIYDQPLNTSPLRLQVTVTGEEATLVRVVLLDRRDSIRPWEIAAIVEESGNTLAVERADDHSLVLSRTVSDYGVDGGRIKLFFDAETKRLLKRIDFDPSRDIAFADDADASRRLGIALENVAMLRRRGVLSAPTTSGELALPAPFEAHPLPQSAFQEFARARPGRVADGYSQPYTRIEERVGAYQRDGDQFWVARAFYDGEGTTGVGGIGTVDAAGRYAFLHIPELFDWSVEGLLVEPDAIWAGRVNHPEGADRSGGLLRYDRRTRKVRLYDVPDVIHSIARVGDAIFLGTRHGLYVIGNGTRTRFRAEPDIDGRFIVVSEKY